MVGKIENICKQLTSVEHTHNRKIILAYLLNYLLH